MMGTYLFFSQASYSSSYTFSASCVSSFCSSSDIPGAKHTAKPSDGIVSCSIRRFIDGIRYFPSKCSTYSERTSIECSESPRSFANTCEFFRSRKSVSPKSQSAETLKNTAIFLSCSASGIDCPDIYRLTVCLFTPRTLAKSCCFNPLSFMSLESLSENTLKSSDTVFLAKALTPTPKCPIGAPFKNSSLAHLQVRCCCSIIIIAN